MIRTLSQRVARYLVHNGAKGEDEAALAYGAECFLNECLSMALLVLVGIFSHHVWELVLWSISFSLLRVNLGGLHASTHGWCITFGTLIGASSLIISPILLQHTVFAGILTLLAGVTACVIAPVPHKNKQHVQAKRREIKHKVILVVIFECITMVLLYFLNPVASAYIASGLLLASLLAVGGLLWNPR